MKYLWKWFWPNLFFVVVLYFATIKNNPGAENIASFMIFLLFLLSLFIFIPEMGEKLEASIRKRPKYLDKFSSVYDIIISLYLFYIGWMWLGGLFVFSAIMQYGATENARKEQVK